MGRKTILTDDFDGQALPDDTSPINLSLGRTTYALYLSEDNYGKLLKAVEPFIESAETVERSSAPARSSSSSKTSNKNRLVRQWAQDSGFQYKGADGEMRTLGDRGQIPEEVHRAYEEQNA